MIKQLFVFTLSSFILSGAIAASKYSCSNVGGTEEWTVYVDLDQKKAGFFDNDTTVVMPLTQVRSLESFPPQTAYTFEGQDGYGKIRVNFNETRLSASVTLNVGTRKQKTLEALNGCVVDESVVID